MGNQKVAYQQLKTNPKFELSTTSKDGHWIRIHGKAVFDERPHVIERAFELFPDVRSMYSKENGPRLATFYVDGGEAIIANMRGDCRTIAL